MTLGARGDFATSSAQSLQREIPEAVAAYLDCDGNLGLRMSCQDLATSAIKADMRKEVFLHNYV